MTAAFMIWDLSSYSREGPHLFEDGRNTDSYGLASTEWLLRSPVSEVKSPEPASVRQC